MLLLNHVRAKSLGLEINVSTTISKAFSIALQFITTTANSRRTEFSGLVGVSVNTSLDVKDLVLVAAPVNGSTQTVLSGTGFTTLSVVTDTKIYVSVTFESQLSPVVIPVTSALVLTGTMANITISNTSQVDAIIKIALVA